MVNKNKRGIEMKTKTEKLGYFQEVEVNVITKHGNQVTTNRLLKQVITDSISEMLSGKCRITVYEDSPFSKADTICIKRLW